MKAWAILVAGVLAGQGCSQEAAPRPAPAATVPKPSALDALLDYVPPSALAVVAVDLEQVRRSPALTRAVERLLTQLGHDASLIAGARALVIALVPGPAGESPAALLVVAARTERQVLGLPDVVERATAAHLGASITEEGELREACAAVRDGNAGFAAARMTDSLRSGARDVLPDLATAAWIAGTVDIANGLAVTGIGAFPDLTTAARIAGAVDLGKSLALGELRSTAPVAARAIGKLVARPVGSTLRVTATLDEAEAAGLLGVWR